MSKGSVRRPATVTDRVIEENWQRIFGDKKTEKIIFGEKDEH